MGFALFWTWFVWPMFAVAVAETFQQWRVDCGCDVLSWMMKTASFTIVVVVTHPLNPHHDRCFDFSRQFVHARYVQNDHLPGIFEESDEDDADTPKTEIPMTEMATKFGGNNVRSKKKNKDSQKKLFQYGKRGNVPVDSEEEDDSEEDSDESSDDDAAGNNIKISAISMDAAKETLRGGE